MHLNLQIQNVFNPFVTIFFLVVIKTRLLFLFYPNSEKHTGESETLISKGQKSVGVASLEPSQRASNHHIVSQS